MTRLLLGAGILVVLASAPAFAIAPGCHDQLAQIKGEMSAYHESQSDLANKYQEAERLCNENKEEQAQAMARQIRDEMAQKSGNPSSSSGSSTNPSSTKSK